MDVSDQRARCSCLVLAELMALVPADFGGGGTAGAVAGDAGPKVCDTWGRGDPSAFETVFAEVDSFMNSTLASALRVRDELAPGVGVALGEWGVSPKGDIDSMCYQVRVCPVVVSAMRLFFFRSSLTLRVLRRLRTIRRFSSWPPP